MEGGRPPLHRRGIGKQVTGDLFDRKLIERYVFVEGGDDPVAPAPGRGTRAVDLETVGVGVPGLIEPMPAPPLAEVRAGEQSLDEPLVIVGARVGAERIDVVDGGEQSR